MTEVPRPQPVPQTVRQRHLAVFRAARHASPPRPGLAGGGAGYDSDDDDLVGPHGGGEGEGSVASVTSRPLKTDELNPLPPSLPTRPLISPSPPCFSHTLEIAFIGLGLDGPAIDAALTACLCSDGEMAAAAAGALEDPFVEWPSIEVGRGRGPGGVLEGMFEHRGGSGMGRGQGNPGPDLVV